MADNFTNVLRAIHGEDRNAAQMAEKTLKEYEEKNFQGYLASLCTELAGEDRPDNVRQLAGLMLKNTVDAKSEAESERLAKRWMSLPEPVRGKIREMSLAVLASASKAARSAVTILVAKIAAIEIPQGQWTNLVDLLVRGIGQAENQNLRQASFEALGYVCEEVDPDYLKEKSNTILNAIAVGFNKTETDPTVRLAAVVALLNSLEFVRKNFEKKEERDLIMQMVFTACQSDLEDVRVAAFSCLVEIGTLYYDFLSDYIQFIFQATLTVIEKDKKNVQLQAVEFWSTICDMEIERQEENEELEEGATKQIVYNFALGALPKIAPVLLQHLTQQSGELDDDEWNMAMASGTCLGLFAQATKDAVVSHILPFVEKNIMNPDWHYREAAILAFGCLLDGPDREKLMPLVTKAMPVIVGQIADSHPVVKDTAAWTVGRICNLMPECVGDKALPVVIGALGRALGDAPKIASNACWAIHNLANHVEVVGKTSPLSPFFKDLVTALMNTVKRSDADEANLLGAAYEALNSLVHTAAPDVYQFIVALMPELVKSLEATLTAGASSAAAREQITQAQALLCGSLQEIIQKLPEDVILPTADGFMTLFLKVLNTRQATVLEEALLAIGALAGRLGANFFRYLEAFKPFLLQGLRNTKEHLVCVVAVGVVGDIARALETQMASGSTCDDIMQVLLANLQNASIERAIKPHIVACLGDIALAVGGYFDRYMVYVSGMLTSAAQTRLEHVGGDYDYLCQLRESILECWTGILQGLAGDNKAELVVPSVDNIIQFLITIANDEHKPDSTLRSAAGVVGDLASRLPSHVQSHLRLEPITRLIMDAISSDEDSTKKAGTYAKRAVGKVIGASFGL